MASATRDALSALVGPSRREKESRGPALGWRALHRPSMKRHALDIARSAITPRAVARCRGVRRGADAEHDSAPGRLARGRMRSCLRYSLRPGDRGERALVVAGGAGRWCRLYQGLSPDFGPAVPRPYGLW